MLLGPSKPLFLSNSGCIGLIVIPPGDSRASVRRAHDPACGRVPTYPAGWAGASGLLDAQRKPYREIDYLLTGPMSV